MRHAFITAALDAGVPLRDVQEAASHADPRTTMRYDRARTSLDRHATYIVAAFIAGAARPDACHLMRGRWPSARVTLRRPEQDDVHAEARGLQRACLPLAVARAGG